MSITATYKAINAEQATAEVVSVGAADKIRFYPRLFHTARMVGGVFEGTNGDPINGPYATIYTISSSPPLAWNEVSADLKDYRYLRYRGPDNSFGNVAEIEFYRDGEKLTEGGFGTPGSWNNEGSTFDKALDGNTDTFFDSQISSGAYVGIDTSETTSADKIRFYPRLFHAARMVGGVFEGTNEDPINGPYATIYTISSSPPLAWNEVSADLKDYRYLRYRGPDDSFGNVAEIEFYRDGVRLTGTGFGTPGSWNNEGSTFDKALDGNTDTFFDSQINTGAYVGIDAPVSQPPPSGALQVSSGAEEIFVVQGSSQNVVSTVNVTNAGSEAVNVQNVVSITPEGGVSFTSDYPSGGWNASTSQSFVLNQSFNGLEPGDYTITNTSTIIGKGVTASDSIVVHVLPPGGNPVILGVGAVPDAVKINLATEVIFTATIASYETAPDHLDLHQLDGGTDPIVAVLRDDGLNGDLQSDDGVYSGTTIVTAPGEGTIEFQARGSFPGASGEKSSPSFLVVASPLPLEPVASDLSKTVDDPVTGAKVVSNEVLVTFHDDLTSSEVLAFAAQFNATVAGVLHNPTIYQMVIPNPAGTADLLNMTLSAMRADPRVATAGPNFVVSVQEVVPNDPQFGNQWELKKIRADEAWVVARGAPVIAVVDTGVDYNYEDLAGKVFKGRDLWNSDNDPMDDFDFPQTPYRDGHGTAVAAIAAGTGNNGKGIAGVAWNSKVGAIKVTASNGDSTIVMLGRGIEIAAWLGAKVINVSMAGPVPGNIGQPGTEIIDEFEKLVNRVSARAIVVAAAGNEGKRMFVYPGWFRSAFCVGATTQSDGRATFSNFGPHVDIAAPGQGVTVPTLDGLYLPLDGTSFATPYVSGAIALVWNTLPSLTPAEVIDRLKKTAVELQIPPAEQLGAGRLDAFEAVFNGSFEDDMRGWTTKGTSGSIQSLGPLSASDRKKFGFASSGPNNAVLETTLERSFVIQSDVTDFKIAFDYDFVTEEYPEFINKGFNDNMRMMLVKPDGTSEQLAFEDVNSSSFTAVAGVDFPGGDQTVGHTGWKTISKAIPVTSGPGIYRIIVRDAGDGVFDSNVLIDKIRFRN